MIKKLFIIFIFLLTCLIIHPKVVSAQLVYITGFENATTNSRGWYLNLDPDSQYGVPLSNYINGDGHQWIEGVESRPSGATFPSNFPGPHSGNRCLGLYYLNGSTTADRSNIALWTNPWAGTVNENPSQVQPDLTDNEFYISEWLFLPNFTLTSTTDQWYGLFQYSNILGDAFPYYQFEILGHTGHPSLVPANTLVAVLDWRDESGLQHYYQPYQNFQNVLPIERWFKLEWYTLRDATNGTIKVWVDGVKIFDMSGLNTKHVTLPTYPEPDGEPYSLDVARIYMGSDSNPHWLFVDDIEIWNGMPEQQELTTLYGKLVNKNEIPIQATISVGSIENSTLSDGTYSIKVPKGIYDINYSTQNLWIKLISFNLSSDQKGLINHIAIASNRISFDINITKNQITQVFSDKKPSGLVINRTNMTEVSSLQDLTNNTWFYNSTEKNLYIIANPTACNCTNWMSQNCGAGGCLSNQTYQTRTCSPSGCAATSQCVYNSSCVPTCSDGTQYGQCSSNKPKYCNNGNLTDKCSLCNCPTGYNCLANESCNPTTVADYTITGSGETAIGTENIVGGRTTSGATVTVINMVLGWMTNQAPRRTVEFIGNFTIGSQANDITKNIIMDFKQAKTTVTVPMAFYITGTVDILGGHNPSTGADPVNGGGHFIGTATGFDVIRLKRNCLVDGIDGDNFEMAAQYDSSYNTIQNCNFHDNVKNNYFLVLNGNGHNIVQNNKFIRATGAEAPLGDRGAGIFIGPTSGYNLIDNNEFAYLSAHAIYSDGSSTNTDVGHQTVTNNIFRDNNPSGGGAIHFKTHDNEIAHNTFLNWTNSYTISIYSEWVGYHANGNDIHDNTFTNCLRAVVLGHGNYAASPTIGNLVHGNVFTNCTYAISLDSGIVTDGSRGCSTGSCPGPVVDTKIYYNEFHNCTDDFTYQDNHPELTQNTIIAYNTFGATVPSAEVTKLKAYVNTMIYGNTPWMADFNPVTDPSSPYYIPPPP